MLSPETVPDMLHLGELITRHLEGYQPMPESVRQMIFRSVLRHLDSRMIIEDSLTPLKPLAASATSFPLPAIDCLPLLDRYVVAVREEGLGPYFNLIIGLFGHIMLQLSGSDRQQEQVAQWVSAGGTGAFLMTDSGGPSLHQWRSKVVSDAQGALQITLDKEWGIGALTCAFAIVILSRPGQMVPQAWLIPPETCAQWQRKRVGSGWLDGHVQLGNCQGVFPGSHDWALRRGGLIAVKQFLTYVRPRFVASLMHHLHWLMQQKRLTPDSQHDEAREYLLSVTRTLSAQQVFNRYSEDEVMALKFASNALLFDLVEQQRVRLLSDQRDLLGFTKMEGSSYRCLMEICQRHRVGHYV